MRKITHLMVGGIIGIIFSHIFSTNYYLFGLVGAFYGLLPDYDIYLQKMGVMMHRSVISHSFISSIIYSLSPILFSYFIEKNISYYYFLLSVNAFFAILSHNIMDSLTRGGVKLLYPISKRKIKGPFKSNDALPNILIIAIFLMTLSWILVG